MKQEGSIITPVWIRLPKQGKRKGEPGETCPYTGLGRGKLNRIIRLRKDGRPVVVSKVLREPKQKRGTRLINYSSLLAFIEEAESA